MKPATVAIAGSSTTCTLEASPRDRVGGQSEPPHHRARLIARKLMLLDLVIATPEVEWFASEGDKVALFTNRFGVPRSELPLRTYEAGQPETPQTGSRIRPKAAHVRGQRATQTALRLPRRRRLGPRIRIVSPRPRASSEKSFRLDARRHCANAADFTSSKRTFKRFCGQTDAILPGFEPEDLRGYCETRRAVERNRCTRSFATTCNRVLHRRQRVNGAAAGREIPLPARTRECYREFLDVRPVAVSTGRD